MRMEAAAQAAEGMTDDERGVEAASRALATPHWPGRYLHVRPRRAGVLVNPVTGSAWQPARPGDPKPLDAGMLALLTLPASPFWARRYTRFFLGSCRGISAETAETAELRVFEFDRDVVTA